LLAADSTVYEALLGFGPRRICFMRVPSGFPLPIAMAVATALLTGCASHGATALPAAGPVAANTAQSITVESAATDMTMWHEYVGATSRAPRANGSRPLQLIRRGATLPSRLTYMSDYFANTVTILDRRAYLVGVLQGFDHPQGMFVDQSHALWVANTHAQNVLVFNKGSTKPDHVLSDPGEFPVDVSVCPDGTVYVSNIISSKGVIGSISVYAGGSTSPTGTLQYPKQGKNYFLTCDAAGNVFTTLLRTPFTQPPSGGVVEYVGGQQSGARLLPIKLQVPGGIKPHKKNLVVNDQVACTVTEYTEAGKPTGNAVTYGNVNANDWSDIAVTRDGNDVAGADAVQVVGTELAFPSGTLVQTYYVPVSPNGNLPTGIAFDPPQKSL
jgi:hypothetical protein